MPTQDLKYRPDIDGLRALAVLSVMLFHFGATWLPGGFVGVDIFFVISGFLITAIIVREMDQGSFSFARFYQRRFRRIFPALWVVLLVCMPIAGYLMLTQERVALSWSAIAATASVSNVFFWKHLGYFDGGADETPLLHTWSLSVEEQYYILFPIFLLLAHRYLRKHLPALLMVVIAASLAGSMLLTEHKPSAAFYLPVSRAFELCLGALFALLPAASVAPRKAFALCLTGLLLCFGAIAGFNTTLAFPGALALIPCAGAALLLYFGGVANPATAWLGNPVAAWIGRISYSLYLWHWPILVFYKYYVMRPLSGTETAGLLVAIFLAATLSYRLVETPFRKAIKTARPRRDLGLAVLMFATVIVPASLTISHDGFPDPQTSAMLDSLQKDTAVQKDAPCFFNDAEGAEAIPDLARCRLKTNDKPGTRRVLLWGDSYANHYVGEIRSNPAFNSLNVTYLTHTGCPPYLQYYDRNCNAFNQAVLKMLESGQFDTVMISGNWWSYSRTPDFLRNIQQVTQWLKTHGLTVYMIGASPVYHTRVPQIAYRDWKFGKNNLTEYKIEFDDTFDTDIEDAVKANASYFSPYRQLCKGNSCRFRDADGLLHIDQGHLSAHGAHLVFERFLAEYGALLRAQP
ncbi:MAG TPA: acyltransferase family protein [Rhodocyclaceae bacterium]|nr:acyltransferase family protein [Rhodocyclaceae bacterium]